MKFIVGCDLEEFEKYYKTLDDLHNYFKAIGLTDVTFGEIGDIEKLLIKSDQSHLIVWKKTTKSSDTPSGTNQTLTNTEKVHPETKKTNKC